MNSIIALFYYNTVYHVIARRYSRRGNLENNEQTRHMPLLLSPFGGGVGGGRKPEANHIL